MSNFRAKQEFWANHLLKSLLFDDIWKFGRNYVQEATEITPGTVGPSCKRTKPKQSIRINRIEGRERNTFATKTGNFERDQKHAGQQNTT